MTTPDVAAIPDSVGARPSLLLYGAGLLVTLSGLYAVNYGLESPDFATATYSLAVAGYTLSYALRAVRVPVRSVQAPLATALVALLLVALMTDQRAAWLAPPGLTADRSHGLQLLFVYLAIVHTFLLGSDAAVLFACVPCMTMLALVSTTSADSAVQYAFFVFFAAATVLVVHDNYLRTQRTVVTRRVRDSSRSQFVNQFLLSVGCVGLSLLLANIVQVPVAAIGQGVFLPSGPGQAGRQNLRAAGTTQIRVEEQRALDLRGGGAVEDDSPLLRVRCETGLYWRGATFNYYTGQTFENRARTETRLLATAPSGGSDRGYDNSLADDSPMGSSLRNVFSVPVSALDGLPANGAGLHLVHQTFTVLGGVTSNIYGAATPVRIRITTATLTADGAGAIKSAEPLPVNASYDTWSLVPDDAPERLQAARGSGAAIPPAISGTYLQTSYPGKVADPRMQRAVRRVIAGRHTPYERVVALRDYVAATCRYNLNAAAPPLGVDVVDWFLFTGREGYCDKFAASLAVLCRFAGIPARVASGFITGDVDNSGAYIVRTRDKHAWTEVYFAGVGWIPFDATDGAVNVTDPNARNRRSGLGFIAWLKNTGPLGGSLIALILGVLLYVVATEMVDGFRSTRTLGGLATRRSPDAIRVVVAYQAALISLRRSGVRRAGAETIAELARRVDALCAAGALPGVGSRFHELSELTMPCVYSTASVDRVVVERAEQLAMEVDGMLRRHRPLEGARARG